MLYPSFENDKNYLFKKFQNPEFDPATGIEKQAVLEQVTAYADEWKDRLPVTIIKSRCFELACNKMQIDVNPHDCFPGFGCYDRSMRPYKRVLGKFCSEVVNKQISKEVIDIWNDRQDAGLHTVWPDFDHSVPEWENVFELGFPGLRDRARAYREKHAKNGTLTKEVEAYFDGIEITLNAILECIGRLIDYAKEHHSNDPRIQREIRCLEQMRNGAPRDTYEILMIIYLYFYFGEYIDHMQVRSMSNLDAVIYPYYKKDLAEGRYSAMDIREFITCFLMQWGSIDNYWGHPLYLGGTAADGSTLYNECSSLILEIFEELDIPTPKLQLKLAKNSPDSIIKQALRMVREHNSSLVFISDENAQDILIKDGCSPEDARDCNITGCYGVSTKHENRTGSTHVNMLKCVELAMNNGYSKIGNFHCECGAMKLEDMKTFDDFVQATLTYLDDIIKNVMRVANESEKYLRFINPGPLYSSTVNNSLETGLDAFSDGTLRKKTNILMCGLGTTVDALMAVKKAVFDEKLLTLTEFRDILNRNWEGAEKLRLKMLNMKEKYGNGIPEVDQYGKMLADFSAERIVGVPNSRGGSFTMSGHSARQFIVQGEKTAATPDGRKEGDEFSKNLSPTMGADTNGVTALSNSICTLNADNFPGDFPLDVMMLPATIQGEEGLEALKNYIYSHFAKGGRQIHFNIFNAETLIDAKEHPEKYQNLQIRVCGWNVHFVELNAKEQDMYIARALRIAE